MIYGLLAAAYGMLMSIQAACCTLLTEGYGNWFSTLTVHLTGLIAFSFVFFLQKNRKTGKAPWYLYLGGTIGVANVVFCNYAMVRIGMTNSNMLMLLSEIVFSGILDSFGLMGMKKQKISGLKWVAIAVMLLGIGASYGLSEENVAIFSIGAVLASLMRGICMVVFRQLNGQLGLKCGSSYSTYMTYVTGSVAAFVVFAFLRFPMSNPFPNMDVPFWAYASGCIGCVGIFLCNLSSPKLSALTMSLVVFVSETAMGMVFDLFRGKLSLPTVIGCLIVSFGMVLNVLAEKKSDDEMKKEKADGTL